MKINSTELSIVLIIGMFLTGLIIQPYFESKNFNRLTGKQTTYWDALFNQLRIQGDVK